MGILEELWYGNISPCEMDFKRGSKYSELLGYIVRHEEDLQKRLNDEEKEAVRDMVRLMRQKRTDGQRK